MGQNSLYPELPAGLQTQMGMAVKYLTALKDKFWLDDGLSPYALGDGDISQTWDGTDNQAAEPPTAMMVGFSSAQAGRGRLWPARATPSRQRTWPSSASSIRNLPRISCRAE